VVFTGSSIPVLLGSGLVVNPTGKRLNRITVEQGNECLGLFSSVVSAGVAGSYSLNPPLVFSGP
jgi:hypothetical protein